MNFQAEDYFPENDRLYLLWKIYWVTKRCTVDVTQYPAVLDGSVILGEVNKRFCGMIDGENWDVYQSFLDLFDPNDTKWGSCVGKREQKYGLLTTESYF